MAQRTISTGLSGDAWVPVDPVPGWESHLVEVLVELVDGAPRVVGLRLTPKPTGEGHPSVSPAQVLTAERLRTVPVRDLARAAISLKTLNLKDLAKDLAKIAKSKGPLSDPRARTTVEQVAQIYARARRAGLPARAEVCRQLDVSPRTADRYLAEARRRGLLPGPSQVTR